MIKVKLFKILLIISDLTIIYLSFVFAYWLRFYANIIPASMGVPPFEVYQRAIYVVMLLWFIIFLYSGFYVNTNLPAIDEFVRIVKMVLIGTVVVMAITFIYRDFTFSRIMVAISLFFSPIFLYISRELLKTLYSKITSKLLKSQKVIIIGTGKIANDLKEILTKSGIISMQIDTVDGDTMNNFINHERIDEVIWAKFPIEYKRLLSISDLCEKGGIILRVVPDIFELKLGEVIFDNFLGIPVFHLKSVSLHGFNFFVKRTFDIIFSLCVFLIFGLPLGIIAFLIKLEDGGSVFYWQERVGYKGKNFKCLKFRTMVVDADKMINNLKSSSDRKGPVFKMRDDPRITRVGRFIRRFSIDEMPQFINVVLGEMSVVGPRPQVLWEADYYDDWARRRLNILPGITGLWQTRGRAELSYEEMIRLDIFYLENWSLGLDIKIILKTIPAILSSRGAY